MISPGVLDLFGANKWTDKRFLVAALITMAIFSGIWFAVAFSAGLADLPYAIKQDYMTVTGKVTTANDSRSYRNRTTQEINIEGEIYHNNAFSWQKAERGKTYTLKYLPNSKTVMEIIGPLPDETVDS